MAIERILVVDDNPHIVRLCTRVLAGEGYQVQGVSQGREALALLASGRFDLLLLDIKMPDIDGLAVLRQARQLDPEVTAVIITGYGTLENSIEALRAGARGLVPKPLTPDDLLTAVNEALERKRLEQENLRLRVSLPILEVSQALMSKGTTEQLAARLLEIIGREFEADRASLMLLNEEKDELYIAGAIGLPAEVVEATRVKRGQSIAGRVLDREEPLILNERAGVESPFRELMTKSDIASAVCTPLRTRERAIGVLNVARLKGKPPFNQSDLTLLSISCGQIATALENALLYQEVARGREALARERNLLRILIDNLPNYIYVKDTESRFVINNIASRRALGATTPDEPVGKTDFDFYPQELAAQYYADEQELIRSGQPLINREESHMDLSTGDRRWLSTTKVPLRDSEGKIVGLVGVGRDITEQKRMQAHLIQTEKLAALGRLAASLAHEINNPLQALHSGLRLLLKESLEEEKRQRYLTIVNREVERLISIVERMLSFYRPSKAQRGPTDINAVLIETLALAGKKLQHAKVTVEKKLAAELPPVQAVADQLNQVFLNIILNAIDAMPQGGALTLETGWEDGRRQEVWAAFIDSGEGIPASELDKVFEPFYTTKLKGTGLGLSISYSIVERHGGRIEVKSEVGQGSTFTVWLPMGEGE